MDTRPIGVFDSGIGGITLLANAIKELPNEKFVYFGDSINAPYGIKDSQTIVKLTVNATQKLMEHDIKALVIACNTATSVAIEELRKTLKIPVIGLEPALKPAAQKYEGGSVVVMATPLTLKEKKFNSLMEKFNEKTEIIPLPCPGLVELIEAGIWKGEKINTYLGNAFEEIDDISAVVLGCTHYIFLREEIDKFFNNRMRYNQNKIEIFDGNQGAVQQLKKLLQEENKLNHNTRNGYKEDVVEYNFSSKKDKVLSLCKEWVKEQVTGNNE